MMRLIRWFVGRIRRILGLSSSAPAPLETPAKKKRDYPVRLHKVRHYGPDMPKRQPCSHCVAWSRRSGKEIPSRVSIKLGAWYLCRTHGTWFIPHPTMQAGGLS